MYTQQQTFDIIVKHLLTQNERAVTSQGDCVLLDEQGRRCAMGAVCGDVPIGSRNPHDFLNGPIKQHPSLIKTLEPFGFALSTFAATLVGLHDSVPPDRWRDNLQSIAQRFNLVFNDV